MRISSFGSRHLDWAELGPQEAAVWLHEGTAGGPKIGQVGPIVGQPGHSSTIFGEGFDATPGTVRFGNTPANITSWSNTRIETQVPNLVAGKYDISVSTDIGTSTYDSFEILSGDQTTVRFIVNNALTSFGQNVYVVGNVHELGNWDPAKAIGPMYNQVLYQYPTWYIDVSVPEGTPLPHFSQIDLRT